MRAYSWLSLNSQTCCALELVHYSIKKLCRNWVTPSTTTTPLPPLCAVQAESSTLHALLVRSEQDRDAYLAQLQAVQVGRGRAPGIEGSKHSSGAWRPRQRPPER